MSEEEFASVSHYLVDHVSKWARSRPDDVAIVDADEGQYITWCQFENAVNLRALELAGMGFQKGDVMVTMLPLLPEHVFLEYAAFKIGMVVCPLDVRLKAKEVVYCIKRIAGARRILYVAPDDTDSEDKYGRAKRYEFKQIAMDVKKACPFVADFLFLGPQEDAPPGATGILNLLERARRKWKACKKDPALFKAEMDSLEARKAAVDSAKDGAMIIFTTGSTGFPKPAVLSNAGIVCQNMCMQKGFGIKSTDRLLLNLPMSHVAAQTVGLMSLIFAGGMAVILHGFRADKSLQAIQDYKVTIYGQVPALFALSWSLPNFKDYDLSSIRLALYGAQGMTRNQLEKFVELAPTISTGLGMTEMSGFVTYQLGDRLSIDDFVSGLGHDFPITPMSVREPMNDDGTAGKELPLGQVGEICFSGPQVFLGYFKNEEATRKAISKEGILYTGDMGFADEAGLHLAGRRKFILKPKGYQVYPAEIENFVAERFKDRVENIGIIGMPHEIFSEGIIACLETKHGKRIEPGEVFEACKELAAYKRPTHVVILGPEEMPLNRTEKTDYMALKKLAEAEVAKLRAAGKWDARESRP
ncbi:MAG: acyl--CoA ligase [Candidatus Lokiarchaeota archaeon]|nr:acyl--CoA ligase [Candidatus Lokiarchaeota archaeon]